MFSCFFMHAVEWEFGFDSAVDVFERVAIPAMEWGIENANIVAIDEIANMDRGIVAKTERVLMARGTYPKRWKTGEAHDAEGSRRGRPLLH